MMNIIIRFYLLGISVTQAPLKFDTELLMEPGEGGGGEVPADPGQLDFSKTEPSGHLVTIGVL